MIVSDWLWVSRQRSEGGDLALVPYSTAVGAVMVGPQSPLGSLADLRGKTIGVAGGPLDKSWLLLRALVLRRHGFDLAAESEVVYGAPPLMSEKALSGELDAVLNFWHFCARLEADGFRRLLGANEAARELGAKGDVSALGYVFHDAWASRQRRRAGRLPRSLRRRQGAAGQIRRGMAAPGAAGARRGRRARHPARPLPRGHPQAAAGRGGGGRGEALCGARLDRRRQAGRPCAGHGAGHVLGGRRVHERRRGASRRASKPRRGASTGCGAVAGADRRRLPGRAAGAVGAGCRAVAEPRPAAAGRGLGACSFATR